MEVKKQQLAFLPELGWNGGDVVELDWKERGSMSGNRLTLLSVTFRIGSLHADAFLGSFHLLVLSKGLDLRLSTHPAKGTLWPVRYMFINWPQTPDKDLSSNLWVLPHKERKWSQGLWPCARIPIICLTTYQINWGQLSSQIVKYQKDGYIGFTF